MKGVSEVIVIILILMITAAMASLAFMFFSSTVSDVSTTTSSVADSAAQALSTSITIDGIAVNTVYVRNSGKNDLSDIAVFVNDAAVEFSSDIQTVSSGETATITVSGYLNDGDKITVSTPSGYQYAYVDICESTAGCWKFDEGGGSDVYDGSPYNNDGTVTGASWLTPSGLIFSSSSDKVTAINPLKSETFTLVSSLLVGGNQSVLRYDDGTSEDASRCGDGGDDGISKWLDVTDAGMLSGNVSLWIYGRAVGCNSTAYNSFSIRVNDNASQTIVFNLCDLFGLDSGSSLVSSGFEWVKVSIPSSWLVVGENKFNFWDVSTYWYSNWCVGSDRGSFYNKSAWCSNCGLGINPPKGHNMTDREAMMFITNSRIADANGLYGIEASRSGTGTVNLMGFVDNRGREFLMPTNSQSRLAFYFNGSAISIDINGASALSSAISSASPFGTGNITFGGFNGTIYNARIYNRVIY